MTEYNVQVGITFVKMIPVEVKGEWDNPGNGDSAAAEAKVEAMLDEILPPAPDGWRIAGDGIDVYSWKVGEHTHSSLDEWLLEHGQELGESTHRKEHLEETT